ncbi:MAG: hypothetical protein MJZ40_00415 [Bacteroidaceae bacterium]|nr:hypothetical protein [Bacteroidaceae bacterium]
MIAASIILATANAATPKRRKTTDERVHLVNADDLSYDQYVYPGAQILVGNVVITHTGMKLTCDSAVIYEATNSFMAVGRVRMVQGDTLTLTGDSLYYSGESEMAEVRRNVVLTHRKTKLYTDNLNYDRVEKKGYFFDGGRMIDGDNDLTAAWGEDHTATRQAVYLQSGDPTDRSTRSSASSATRSTTTPAPSGAACSAPPTSSAETAAYIPRTATTTPTQSRHDYTTVRSSSTKAATCWATVCTTTSTLAWPRPLATSSTATRSTAIYSWASTDSTTNSPVRLWPQDARWPRISRSRRRTLCLCMQTLCESIPSISTPTPPTACYTATTTSEPTAVTCRP